MDVFVARQPIFNTEKRIYAYELLFRTGVSSGFPDIEGNIATTSLLSSSFFTVGIDKIAAGKLVFINFTEDLLLRGTPELFPKEKLMIEVLEDVEPTSEIIEKCTELKEKGFQLALDDFVYSKKFDVLLELSDIIKIDFRLTPLDVIEVMVETLEKYNCQLLAEKVETYEEFDRAISLGFEYFQGYFFAKPEVLQNKDLSASQLTMVQLISNINNSEFDVMELEKLVVQDVSVSYKLLNYINSAHFSRIQPISSIRQAISFLGEKEFKMFVSLVATSKLASDKPTELIRLSIIRARFLEQVARALSMDTNEMFLLGLFSLIDAMLDQKMATVLKKLPLTDNLNSALSDRSGELYYHLRLVETYESGNWIAFRYAQKRTGLDAETIVAFYVDAIAWADSFAS
jgi:c-di-GMP-related signal transduction protein